MDPAGQRLPEIGDVRAAAARLKGLIVNTRLVESPALNDRFGARFCSNQRRFRELDHSSFAAPTTDFDHSR